MVKRLNPNHGLTAMLDDVIDPAARMNYEKSCKAPDTSYWTLPGDVHVNGVNNKRRKTQTVSRVHANFESIL